MSYTKFDGELDAPSGAAAGFVPFAGALDGEPPKKRTWGQAAADTGVQLAEGVNTIAGAVPSLVAPDSGVAGFFRDNAESWRAKQSDVLQGRANAASAAIDKAGEDGVISQVVEAAKQYSSDPALAARFVTTNLPSMIPGIGAAKLAQAAALARGASAVGAASLATTAAGGVNSVLNAGGARGEAFEDIKKTLEAQGRSPEEATQIALDKSRLPAAIGGVTGFISGKTGIEGALTGKLSGKVAAAASELAGEQLEEVAPKLATNYQASEYDNRAMSKDVGRTIVETAIGSGPGAIYSGMVSKPEPKTPQQAVNDIANAPDVDSAIKAAEEAVNAAPKGDDFIANLAVMRQQVKTNEFRQALRESQDVDIGQFQNAVSVASNPVLPMATRQRAMQFVTDAIAQIQKSEAQDVGTVAPANPVDSGIGGQLGDNATGGDTVRGRVADSATGPGAQPAGEVLVDGQQDAPVRVAKPEQSPALIAQGNAQPTTLGKAINAVAGPGFNAQNVLQDPRLIPMSRREQSYQPPQLPQTGTELTTVVNPNGKDAKTPTKSEVLSVLRANVKSAPPFTQEHLDAIHALKDAVTKDAENAISNSEAPVYLSKSGLTSVITPSAQNPGMYQVTRYNSTGAIGDSQYKTIGAAIDDNQLSSDERLDFDAANSHMGKLVDAEAKYQERKRVQNTAPGTPAQAQAAPVEAPKDAGVAAVAQAVPAAPGSAGVEAAGVVDANPVPDNKPSEPAHYGTGHRLLTEGGKPFKTERAAKDAKKLQTMMRVKKVKGGYVLTDKTPAQVAAQAKAAARLAAGTTGDAGIPQHAHGFLAREGGLPKSTMSDLGFDKNHRIGSMWLFKANDGMTLERATEKLIEGGYLKEGASHSDAINLIKKSITTPQYTADGWERIAQAEADARFEDHLAAQEESAQNEDFDPFASSLDEGFDLSDIDGVGYDEASDPIKLEVNALLAQAQSLGIDTESIRENEYENTKNGSEQDYFEAFRRALASAIEGGNRDSSQDSGQASNQGAEDFLVSPSREDILARQQAEQDAAKAKEKADKEQEEKDRAERIQKEIDARQRASAENFILGQNAEDALAGQEDVFNQPDLASRHAKLDAAIDTLTDDQVKAVYAKANLAGEKRTPGELRDTLKQEHPDDIEPLVSEAKAVLQPAAQATAILDAAEVKGKERIDILKDVKNGAITPEEVQAAYPAKEAAKIEDSGAVLEGARKLYAKAYDAKLSEGMQMDTAANPLTKTWPEPDYAKLLEGGADPWAVAFAHAARDEIPKKPMKGWKLKGWVTKVEMLRDMANKVLSGEGAYNKANVQTKIQDRSGLGDWMNKIDMYEAVGHEHSLKDFTFSSGSYSVYGGQHFSPAKTLWAITSTDPSQQYGNWGKEWAVGETKDSALSKFKDVFERNPPKEKATKKTETKFDVYSRRGMTGTIIGKKIGKNHIDLKTFPTSKEALAYLEKNQKELETLLEAAKEVQPERRENNSPRIGADHRMGANVSTEQFRETFGFRGEQFGASMPQAERQANLNESYDALMDLAGILNIPPKALSLNGELGLAFGSRGKGGKRAAAAHYERDTTGQVTPNRVVINLTREHGAGSLAHEWFHAVDNYFARMRGEKAGMLTEKPYPNGEGVRPEMVMAFRDLMKAITSTGVMARSRNLDKKRTKDYWSTGLEMAARSFESYVIAKLHEQNAANDYLANIVPEESYLREEEYPYPKAAEMPPIREAFDKFFSTVQTKETDSGVAMFSRNPFFSALYRGIEGIKANVAPANGWKDAIKGLVNKGIAKADEVEWSGLNDWLDLQTGKVQKADLLAFMNAHGVKVTETVLGDTSALQEQARLEAQRALEKEGYSLEFDPIEGDALITDPDGEFVDWDELPENLAQAIDRASDTESMAAKVQTKYSQYTLPGGENYREVLLTLPERATVDQAERRERRNAALAVFPPTVESRAILEETRGDTSGANNYKSSHWDEKNVLAHIRVNDRTDADGKRVLFVEEIQSDWGQDGKKKGFSEPEWWVELSNGDKEYYKNEQEANRIARENNTDAHPVTFKAGKVPVAPFVTKTDAWLNLALKRIITMAVDGGYDKVAFVNGEQSAERYDLSKQIDTIGYLKHSDGTITIEAEKDGRTVHKDNHPSDKIDDVIGKELAQRIIDSPDDAGELSGLDLKVGGSGMITFYDKIVPNAVNALLKKVGGGKLENVEVYRQGQQGRVLPGDAKNAARRDSRLLDQPGFTITDAMRDKASEGLPLFQRGDGLDAFRASLSKLSAPPATDPKVIAQVQAWTDELSAKWTNAPDIRVVASSADLPVPATSDTRGMYYRGTVYVVAGRAGSKRAVGEVLAHESVAHYGLREMLGKDDWQRFMGNIQLAIKSGNKPLNAIRDQIRSVYVDENGKPNLTPDQEADEIAARVVEKAIDANGEFKPGFAFVKSVYAKIAQFLRDIGLNVQMTHMELQGALINAQRYLEAGNRTAGGGQMVVAAAREDAQAARNDQAQTPEFKRWFGDSKVVDADGKPLVVYHGTDANITEFKVSDRGTYGGGIYLTPDIKGANDYAIYRGDKSPTVYPLYVSIKNPATGAEAARVASWKGEENARAELIARGYDGVIDVRSGEIVAFYPEQIKSAIGNNGNFDPQNPDIRYARGTNAPVTNPNDVVGNQGGRSADDSTPGASFDAQAAFEKHGGKGDVDESTDITAKSLAFADMAKAEGYKVAGIGDKYVTITKSFGKTSDGYDKQAVIKVRISDHSNVNRGYHFGDSDINIAPDDGYSRDTFDDALRKIRSAFVNDDLDTIIPNEPTAPNSFGAPMAARSPIQSNTWNSPSTSKFDNIVYTLQNKQIDTKRVVEAIKQVGKDVAESVDVYLREELFHGRSAKRTEDFLNNELTPLLNDMKARGISLDQIDKYLHARHAEEANKVIASRNPDMPDGGSGMKTQEAKDYLNSLGAAERNRLDAVAKKIDGMIATTRQLYADEGLESQDTVDSWGAMFKHYVPLMREDKDGGMGIGQGFSIKGKESKGRVGSSRAVVDILANIAMQREKVIVRGEKNRVATALVGLATENPNPDFWTVGETPHEKVYDPKTNSVVDRIDPMYKSRENVVVAKVKQPDGNINEVAVVFNEDNDRAVRMAASLKNLDALQLNGLLGLSAKISRYISSINTQYNPIFGIVNLARDVQGAMVNLSTTALKGQQKEVSKHVLSALKGVYLDARAVREGKTASSKWAALNEEFQNLGGQTGYRDLFATSEDRAKALQNELMPYAWMDGTLGKIFTANGSLKVPMSVAQDKAKGLFDWLSDYNLAMENAVRLSAFKVGLDQGMTKERAASLAKNLTVNFNRKGQISQQAGALYAFFNAGVQGTARLSQVLFEMDGQDASTIRLSATGKKVVAGGVMLGVAQAVMLAAAGFGDDDPPEFVRERNLIIPTGWTGITGDKAYITIPMPLGLHVLPNVGRVLTEFAMSGFKDPTKRAAKLFGLFTDAFNPMGGSSSLLQMLSPTPIDPLVAIAENKDGMGRTIAKTSRNPAVPGFTLAKDTASKPAKLISEAINYLSGGTEYKAGILSPTPDQVDFLIGQATGGVGRELSKAMQTASAVSTGEELPMHKIPLVGRFYGDSDLQSAQANAFYSAVKRIEEHELEIKGLRKDGKAAELTEYMVENPEARLVPMANRVELQIQNLQKRKRELMKRDADAAQIKAVENQITERMKVFNMVVRNLREKHPA